MSNLSDMPPVPDRRPVAVPDDAAEALLRLLQTMHRNPARGWMGGVCSEEDWPLVVGILPHGFQSMVPT